MPPANNVNVASQSNENQDKYCWICRRKTVSTVNCQLCTRVFHDYCIGIKNGHNYRCDHCIKIEGARKSCEINKDKLNLALKCLVQRLLQDDEYGELNKMLKGDTIISLNLIDDKVSQRIYHTTVELWNDILWIEHNCLIADSSDRTKRIASEFIEFCKNEIFDIDQCEECYELANQNNIKWFTIPCSRMHPMVWAKVVGYPYEAAKAVNVKNDSIVVYFFGDHKLAVLSPKYCFRFSQKSPNKLDWRMDPGTLKEVEDYIKNLGSSFEYSKFGEKFDPKFFRTLNIPEPVVSQPTRRMMIDKLLDDTDEENNVLKKEVDTLKTEVHTSKTEVHMLKTEVDTLKNEFNVKEAKLISEVREVEKKLISLKRQHESDLERVVKETKKKKWCNECDKALPVYLPIFCNVDCGVKGHQKTSANTSLE